MYYTCIVLTRAYVRNRWNTHSHTLWPESFLESLLPRHQKWNETNRWLCSHAKKICTVLALNGVRPQQTFLKPKPQNSHHSIDCHLNDRRTCTCNLMLRSHGAASTARSSTTRLRGAFTLFLRKQDISRYSVASASLLYSTPMLTRHRLRWDNYTCSVPAQY